nr:MAG TPA_asm: hypothetical protein [Caudoviricetes sp.]
MAPDRKKRRSTNGDTNFLFFIVRSIYFLIILY